MTRLVTALSIALVASCSERPELTPGDPGDLDGTWVDCSNDGGNDMRDVLILSGSTFDVMPYVYVTTDGSCGGAGTPSEGPSGGTMTLGAPADAWLGDAVVQATPVDLPMGGSMYYSILWRDTGAAPDVLYVGDDMATAGLGGTSPESRPNVLQTWRPRYRQTIPSAADMIGTWLVCKNNGFSDEREEITITAATMSVSTTEYSSTNDTCTGTPTSASATTPFPFTVGASVYSTLGTTTVTALSVDAAAVQLHTVIWVDEHVTPNVLYVGDELATPGYDASDPARRPTVLQASKPRVKQ
jgi:hypothetical protein